MTQVEINRAVARATGESTREIRHLGFSLADGGMSDSDAEYREQPPAIVDWDAVDSQRLGLFP